MNSDSRTARLMGLFLAAALVAAPGCSMYDPYPKQQKHVCVDNDRDGLCDYDGQPMPTGQRSGTHGHGGYWYHSGGYFGGGTSGYSTSGSGHTGVSSGSGGAKGGIGSHSSSSGG